jgi:DNA-binding beta-propeller fold protein YncE
MRSVLPATALLLAISFALAFSGCSSSATADLSTKTPALPPIEFLGAWGAKGVGPGLLADPRTIATDAFGEVYIADVGSSARFIHKFTRDGRPLLSFEPLAPIHNPCATAVDLGGAIYSLECGPGALYIFKPEGDLLRSIRGGLGTPAHPSSVTVDNEGRIYVAESHSKKIMRYTPRGSLLGAWGGKGTGLGADLHADQIVSALDGTLFVCDSDRGWVARISSSGLVQKEWTLTPLTLGSERHCSLAVTKTSVVVLAGSASAPVLHVFSYDGQEKFTKPLQDLDPALATITCAGIAAMQDGEFFILDSAAPHVLHFRLNL